MSWGVRVDPQLLSAISVDLRAGAHRLDAHGNNMPEVPDAGAGEGIIVDLMTHLTAAAGELVSGVLIAADALQSCAEQYVGTDQRNSEGYTPMEGR
jgi:hypothetical protein